MAATDAVSAIPSDRPPRRQPGASPLGTIGQRGQVVIPVAIRRQLGLQPGQAVEIRAEEGRVVLAPLPLDLIGYLRGSLKAPGKTMLQDHLEEHAEEIRRDAAGDA
jgi:AbrB family looped-hinge helix DNA binding protein